MLSENFEKHPDHYKVLAYPMNERYSRILMYLNIY